MNYKLEVVKREAKCLLFTAFILLSLSPSNSVHVNVLLVFLFGCEDFYVSE